MSSQAPAIIPTMANSQKTNEEVLETTGYSHPLDPATATELGTASSIIRDTYKDIPLHFKAAGLEEPPKKLMVEYLEAEHSGLPRPVIPRAIFLMWYIKHTPRLFEAIVDVTTTTIIHHKELPRDFHGPCDRSELNQAAEVVLADEGVKKEIARLQLGENTVVLDPWDYGVDGKETQERHTQVFMYMRNPKNNSPDSNHYAFPLDFMVVVDLVAMKVKRIVRLPLGSDHSTSKVGTAALQESEPVEPEYDPKLTKTPARTTLKPYNVVQPEGPSFNVKGHLIEWEKHRFRVGFNWREGMTLHDLSFDGRSNFYRLSLSEMFVPYGDPREPLHRKGAFDLGNVGAGSTANNLQLGCDCLGTIKYVSGCVISADGKPSPRPNAICIHEQDNGIQWKHTNHRTGKAVVVRKRELVLQTIITVANYEYIFAWVFDQSGSITFQTRATGILSTQPIAKGTKVPWGTVVADGVMAPYHQHIFNLRIDPAIGGHKNSLTISDSEALPWDEELNPYGTGYVTKEEIVRRAGFFDIDISKNRVFKIVNENIENSVSLTPIGYKLVPIASQLLLAHPGTWHSRRSEFADHAVWVTPYEDRQLFPAGDYTNQSLGGTGITSWKGITSRAPVRNQDIVIWHTYGFTHNPRVEDFPVMPAEIAEVHLKPYNFALFNPTIDVPQSTQAVNKSVLVHSAEKSRDDVVSIDEGAIIGADAKVCGSCIA